MAQQIMTRATGNFQSLTRPLVIAPIELINESIEKLSCIWIFGPPDHQILLWCLGRSLFRYFSNNIHRTEVSCSVFSNIIPINILFPADFSRAGRRADTISGDTKGARLWLRCYIGSVARQLRSVPRKPTIANHHLDTISHHALHRNCSCQICFQTLSIPLFVQVQLF